MSNKAKIREEILRVILDDDRQRRVRYNGSILTTNITGQKLRLQKICTILMRRSFVKGIRNQRMPLFT
jgi:hypothetical protein